MKTLIFWGVYILFIENIFSQSSISMDNFLEKIKTDKNLIILDVRTEREVNGLMKKLDIALHIPLQELQERFTELNKFKDKEILVICNTLNRSAVASEFLNTKGFKTKFVLGGMSEFYRRKSKIE